MKCSDYREFELNKPFTPFQQMVCCLPPHSASLLPSSYSALITDPESPLAKYYPSVFCQDLNGKRKQYESVVILPIIHEQEILEAITNHHCDDSLTEDEKIRNSAEKDYLFYYDESESKWPTPLDSSFFPMIEHCHCKREVVDDFNCIYKTMRRNATEETRHSVFPSLYPICCGFRYSEVHETPTDQNSTKNRFLLRPTTKTIVETESGFPYVNSLQSMKECGMEYIHKIVEYDYPRRKLGLVTELFSYDYGCHWNEKEGNPNENTIHAYKLDEDQKNEVKDKLEKMRSLAMKGYERDPHDIGSLDIEDSMLLVRIQPIYHISRKQENQSIVPFFSHQLIDYPLCLTRKVKEFNLLKGTKSLSAYAPDSVNVGDSVVYIGNVEVDGRALKGYAGVVTSVSENTLKLRLTVPKEIPQVTLPSQSWYTEDYLKDQIPEKYVRLLPLCMRNLYCFKDGHKIFLDINVVNKSNVREGLARLNLNQIKKGPGVLSPSFYSSLANVDQTTTSREILYSVRTVELVKEYFHLFGNVLVKAITFDEQKPIIDNEVLEVNIN